MKIGYLNEMHRCHLLAITEAGVHPRVVMVYAAAASREMKFGEFFAVLVCPRKRHCHTCNELLDHKVRVNLGVLQTRSPVEMQRVAPAETTAPAASHAFPEGAGT